MSAHRTAQIAAEVEPFKGLKTALVEHVRAVQQIHLSVKLVGVVADRTILLLSLISLILDRPPEIVQLLLLPLLLNLFLSGLFSPFIPNTCHIGYKALQ